ncbi:bacteriocin-like protein [Staphylococcus auricularis]|nr:bacteriocin [Staphylococcus auricularis]
MKTLSKTELKKVNGGFWNEVARGVGLLNPETRDYFKKKFCAKIDKL